MIENSICEAYRFAIYFAQHLILIEEEKPNETERKNSQYKECDYLIVCGGFELSREKKYYQGGIDRVSVETRVYIIDMKKAHIVFEKDFGIDTPHPISADHTTGYVNYRDSEAYIRYLLTGH